MKKLLILFLSLTFISNSFSQANCDISENYNDFVTIEKANYKDKEYLIKRIVETNNKTCFSELVNNNLTYTNYLLTNFSSSSNYQHLTKFSDSLTLQTEYIKSLQKDSLFNSVMTALVAKTIEKSIPKDTVFMDKILNIAVKYFSIIGLNEEGNYRAKVCAGINDIKETEKIRKPQIEAFCFSSILKNYKGEEFSMYKEFGNSLKELYKINLGTDPEEKLLRAQGAMYFLMRNNDNLKQMLTTEYEKAKSYLPFVLVDT